MPKKKKYTFYQCKDCELDFLVTTKLNKANCPSCADNIYVEVIKDIWMDKPINYKRPWTDDEDSMILDGRRIGKTYTEISKEMDGRTANAIRHRMAQIKKRNYELMEV